jgi:hypothetical protein
LKWTFIWTGRRGNNLIEKFEERLTIYFKVDDSSEEENLDIN